MQGSDYRTLKQFTRSVEFEPVIADDLQVPLRVISTTGNLQSHYTSKRCSDVVGLHIITYNTPTVTGSYIGKSLSTLYALNRANAQINSSMPGFIY